MTVLHLGTMLDKMLDQPVHVRTDVDTLTGQLYAWTRLSTNSDVPTALVVRHEPGGLVVVPWHAVRDLRRQ